MPLCDVFLSLCIFFFCLKFQFSSFISNRESWGSISTCSTKYSSPMRPKRKSTRSRPNPLSQVCIYFLVSSVLCSKVREFESWSGQSLNSTLAFGISGPNPAWMRLIVRFAASEGYIEPTSCNLNGMVIKNRIIGTGMSSRPFHLGVHRPYKPSTIVRF